MRSFWISLLVFVLLMCSCKTQKAARETKFVSKEKTEMNHIKYQALADTSNVLKIGINKGKLKIIERITVTEYDKDTGAVTKKTEAERETTQDSDKVVAEEETQGVGAFSIDSLSHIADMGKKVASEVKEESQGGQDSFGKWLGIVLGVAIVILIVYFCMKLKR